MEESDETLDTLLSLLEEQATQNNPTWSLENRDLTGTPKMRRPDLPRSLPQLVIAKKAWKHSHYGYWWSRWNITKNAVKWSKNILNSVFHGSNERQCHWMGKHRHFHIPNWSLWCCPTENVHEASSDNSTMSPQHPGGQWLVPCLFLFPHNPSLVFIPLFSFNLSLWCPPSSNPHPNPYHPLWSQLHAIPFDLTHKLCPFSFVHIHVTPCLPCLFCRCHSVIDKGPARIKTSGPHLFGYLHFGHFI